MNLSIKTTQRTKKIWSLWTGGLHNRCISVVEYWIVEEGSLRIARRSLWGGGLTYETDLKWFQL